MLRMASFLCLTTSVALLGLAAYLYRRTDAPPTPETPAGAVLTAREPDLDLGTLPVGTNPRVRFRVANPTGQTVRVVGVSPCCGKNCCLDPLRMDPFDLPAAGEVEIECEAISGEPGSFQCPLYVRYYDGQIQTLAMSVTGTWAAPKVANHVPTLSR